MDIYFAFSLDEEEGAAYIRFAKKGLTFLFGNPKAIEISPGEFIKELASIIGLERKKEGRTVAGDLSLEFNEPPWVDNTDPETNADL